MRLRNHVVEGKALSLEEVAGRETRLDTAAGERLTIDAGLVPQKLRARLAGLKGGA